MLQSFLIALEDKCDALIPYALSAAKALGAHPTAIYPRRDPTGFEDGSLEARLEAAAGVGPARKARAVEVLSAFAQAARAAGIEAEVLMPDAGEDPPRDVAPRFARAFDFTMVQQREAGRAPASDDITAALLAESGRPVWVVPAIQRSDAKFGRVVVAWDGGASAARAISEARVLVARAGQVDIVSVTGANARRDVSQGGERLAARLRRAGGKADFKPLFSQEDPANAILSYAAEVGADLLVSGGYSHSPLRESLFGGATRTLLSSMTLPVFLAH